jgi:hypothetical protein
MPVDYPPPFGSHDYQIDYVPLEKPREVNIGARAALPLQVGDSYTIDRADGVYDLVVEEISRMAGGRWNARCRVSQPLHT